MKLTLFFLTFCFVGPAAPAAAVIAEHHRSTIAPGKLADLLIVEGDPSTTIADVDRVVAVWHRGRRVAGSLATFAS